MRSTFLFCGILLIASFASIRAQAPQLLAPGAAAPSFSLPDLSGERAALSVYCGQTLSKPFVNKIRQTVVLSFWATYCKPCQKELPQLAAFGEKHKADNVVVLCISVDKEGEEAVAPYIKDKGYAVRALLDPYMKTSQRYGVKALPSLFIIDTVGVIRYCSQGFDDKVNFTEKLEKLVAGIKAGKTVAKAPEMAGAEQTAIVGDASNAAEKSGGPSASQPPKKFTPHQKWTAVARTECGEPVEKVAAETGVSIEELKKWRDELKATAIKIWSAEQK